MNMKKGLSLVLVFALLLTLALPAQAADPTPDHMITNSGGQFAVDGANLYSDLESAVAACAGGSPPVVQFGNGGAPLSVPAGQGYYSLISATYTGSIQFANISAASNCGLQIPAGTDVTFLDLILSNQTDTDDFYPVKIISGGKLTVSGSSDIAATYSGTPTSRSAAVIENDGTLIVTGGTIGSEDGASKTIVNSGAGTLDVSGGVIKTALYDDTGCSAITCNGTGDVQVSGGTVSGTLYGIYTDQNSTSHVTVSGGTVESSGENGGVAIVTYGTDITVSGGTVKSNSSAAIAYSGYGSSTAEAEITISGGMVSSNATYSAAIDLGEDGATNISGLAVVTGYSGIHLQGSLAPIANTVNISGGTVEATGTDGAGIDMAANSISAVSITGGTVKSAGGTTLRMQKTSVPDAASFDIYGVSVHSHDEADIRITGYSDGTSDHTITSGNSLSSTVTASNFTSGREFAAWTSDSARETTVATFGTTNGATLSGLFAATNFNIYLKTAAGSAPSGTDTIDVSQGGVQDLPTGVTYDGGTFTIGTDANSPIIITGTTTSNTIAVSGDVSNLMLILNGVTIALPSYSSSPAPIDIQSGAAVTIGLPGGTINTLTASYGYAGLSVPSGASVTIVGDTTGILNATGGEFGAGIGGSGGSFDSAGGSAGMITINSGVVNATSGTGGAGIGGGAGFYTYDGGDGGSVTINGGTVTADAIGMSYAAGIGGGAGGTRQGGDGGTVTINGGTVFARGSNEGGAGIGGAAGHDGGTNGASGMISIDTDAAVTAISTDSKAAIDAASGSVGSMINASLDSALGTTYYLKCGNGMELTLPGNYRNFAFSPVAEASQTVRAYYTPTVFWGSIVVRADSSVNIPVIDISASPGMVTPVTLLVNSTIDVSKGDTDQTLPAGVTYANNLFTIGALSGSPTRTITVVGNNSSSQNTIAVATGVMNLTLILNGVTITSSSSTSGGRCPIDLLGMDNVKLQLADGTSNTLSAANAAACAGIHVPFGATLTVNGTGSLTAQGEKRTTSSYGGAGIGGYSGNANAGTIIINSGTVNAYGGTASAGIGGGPSGTGGTTTINGGIVTATGGTDGNTSGAGIGGGVARGGGTITIGGSAAVTATGGNFSAVIGGGGSPTEIGSTSITIKDTATVTATGGYGIDNNGGGAGIGGGRAAASGTITITGTPVIMAASYAGSSGKPAIDAASGSGTIINAKLTAALSTTLSRYLACNGNKITLPAKYDSFAFRATANSAVNAYSDSDCSTLFGNVVTNPGGSAAIPAASLTTVTSVKLQAAYSATVTVRKDGSAWKSGTPEIQLSTAQNSLTGAVTGTLSDGVYTFTNLTAVSYYVWDVTNNCYTGKSVASGFNPTADYYTVSFHVTDVGDTASGSTISAIYNGTPINSGDVVLGGKELVMHVEGQGASRYEIAYSGIGLNNGMHGEFTSSWLEATYTVHTLVEAVDAAWTVTGLTYTATVNLKKDDAVWADSGKAITLQLESETPTATTADNGVFTADVANGTWKILADGVNTGATVVIANAAASQIIHYYTVTLTSGTGIGSTGGGGTYLSGTDVGISAQALAGYTWSGWTQTASGTPVASSNVYTIPGISSAIAYTANATPVSAPTYALTITAGAGGSAAGGGNYEAGTDVSISATPDSGYEFSQWTISSGTGTFGNASSSATTFTMGAGAATIRAAFTPIGGGSVGVSTPKVSTTGISDVTTSGATLTGRVSSTEGGAVTARGFVIGTTPRPVLGAAGVINIPVSGGAGSFTATADSLLPDTTYHVRAYAVNSAGINYGEDIPLATGYVGDGKIAIPKTGNGDGFPLRVGLLALGALCGCLLTLTRKKKRP